MKAWQLRGKTKIFCKPGMNPLMDLILSILALMELMKPKFYWIINYIAPQMNPIVLMNHRRISIVFMTTLVPLKLRLFQNLLLVKRKSVFKNTGKIYRNADIWLSPTMQMVCVRTATTQKGEQKEPLIVSIKIEFSMPRVYARTVT